MEPSSKIVAGAALVVVALAAVLWLAPGSPGPTIAPAEVAQPTQELMSARSKGDSTAPIVIFEFSDFQCPFCRDFFQETMPALEREYIATGKASLVFLNLPLVRPHPNASRAHTYAMCAAVQGRFWPYHDLLYRHQPSWAPAPDAEPHFRALADSARLDARALTNCLNSGVIERIVNSDVAAASTIGVRSTPSFLIEGLLLVGAEPITTWRPILDSIYRAKRSGAGQ